MKLPNDRACLDQALACPHAQCCNNFLIQLPESDLWWPEAMGKNLKVPF